MKNQTSRATQQDYDGMAAPVEYEQEIAPERHVSFHAYQIVSAG